MMTTLRPTMHMSRAWTQQVLPHVQWYGNTGDITGCAWQVDSRACQPDTVFIARTGKQADGHQFIDDAIARGARAVWIAQHQTTVQPEQLATRYPHITVLVSVDPVADGIALARAWRAVHGARIIGVTGSVGKTSTKELIAHMIRGVGYQVYATRGNENTLIGNALNILSMSPDVAYGVFEMGISLPGEMTHMADLVRPDVGIITAVGHGHLQGLGTVESVAAEKRHIFDHFHADNIGIVGGDNPLLGDFAYQHPVIRFGKKTSNHIQVRKLKVGPTGISAIIKVYQDKYPLQVPVFNIAYIHALMAAVSCAVVLKIPVDQALAVLANPPHIPGRFSVYRDTQTGSVLVDDAYNANPESMRAALAAFDAIPVHGHKMAILGDMLELGSTSPFWHRQLGRLVAKHASIQEVLLVGSAIQEALATIPDTVRCTRVATWQEAVEYARAAWQARSSLLIKGSRGTQLYKLAHELRKELS